MINDLRKVVEDHQCQEFTWDDGTMLVDVTTASALVALYDALGEEQREFMLDKSVESAASFKTIVGFAFR